MRKFLTCLLAALSAGSPLCAQEIVEVPASQAGVALPEDLFALPPGQWFMAKQVSQGNAPCSADACEAGFNASDLVLSVEHANENVRVIAGFRGCEGVAFQEIQTGMRPGSYKRGQVSDLIKDVIKAAEKSCKMKAPSVPKLDVSSLFPRPSN